MEELVRTGVERGPERTVKLHCGLLLQLQCVGFTSRKNGIAVGEATLVIGGISQQLPEDCRLTCIRILSYSPRRLWVCH
jgi:hypothetical protein